MRAGGDRRPVLTLLTAQATSLVGGAVTLVAVPWYVLVTTGSPAATGLVGGLTVLAEVLGGFLGGALVDRAGVHRAAVAARLGSAVAVAAVPALHQTVGIPYWGLAVLVSLRALCDAPGAAAVTAMLPDLAERGRMPLERVNAAVGAIVRGSTLVGAPLAAVLIGLIGPANLLWIDAAAFLASALMIRLAVPSPSKGPVERSGSGYGRELLEGLRYVVRDPLILCIVLTVLVTNFFDSPYSSVVLPVYVREQYGSALPLGVLLTAMAAGGLTGSILYGLVARRLPRRPTYVIAWLGAAAGFCGLAVAPSLPLAAGALLCTGIAAGPINPIIMTVAQERVPAHLRGRVFGSVRAMAFAAMPLGALVGGLALQVISVHTVLAVTGVAYLVVALANAVNPVFRRLEAPVEAKPERGAGVGIDTARRPGRVRT